MNALLWKLGAATLICVGLFLGGYAKGRSDARVAVLADTVKAYKKRTDVDAKVRNMDAADLCIELGGLPDDCEQLRGLEQNPR
ncbi:hypothetical protein EN742_01685 [Mesorhizobium sp. M4A.F.Ca.ET.020.02.1.1]|uniref:hypothetical protein n=1 Tax=Mesorhizobium sp. M4A.F.Ca.ET.020.02.1.1 TaxID=2496652 RepID=UPI000FD57A30|nr:hypothetical protein [Mesorhizobium sp. M4A.F.Ca.ET.020.02.1.1]RVD44653.1 hypothetical protein EN742_01685 [Mesorhizobium sp. M4A.F.Ca.ET.020.02.1.1]